LQTASDRLFFAAAGRRAVVIQQFLQGCYRQPDPPGTRSV